MLTDRPLVLYKDNGDGKEKGGKAPSAKDSQKAYEEWLAKKESGKGSKLKLNDWINNG